ncbi:hypothetical protein [Nostoc sp. TCL26-01]|uniref:hypothetical protein n=1 Tax=Nostoc sp. TCL26-01 TaxID=2576904 RepID=UPI0015C1038D|nr:hypothetical protein [Nostoc sp. TCL26-01]QLE58409.1 hypothetical protein FD725_24580 [Nostoc sp. TCL26-01]
MSNKPLFSLMIVAIAASLTNCSTPPTTTQNTISPAPSPSMAQLRAKTNNTEPKAISGKTVNVTLYTSDVQCQELLPLQVAVPAAEPVTNTVGKIIAAQDTADFNLSGYRVRVRNGIATVDLRLSPQSRRQFASLSSCEQFVLFGSLRKTLTSNPQWKIKDVRFTEKGEDIVL